MAATCAKDKASLIFPDFETGLSVLLSPIPWLLVPRLSRGPSATEGRLIVGRGPCTVSERFLAIFCGASVLAFALPFALPFFDCTGSPAVTVLVMVDIAIEYGTTCPRVEVVGPLVERRPDSWEGRRAG
ncbi:hypothetical protein PHLGIDRAFT_22599 [Phlebiopsis gigantea 11061_1 CR5-6]|uniref:Uncharacterized protein n=1 Tax=Phlebiopsis gigantea (strain 11061_1 CR5-6) TaxID=745531 RepID=A0A0C3NWY0_PHLG1|nr:hypothetical protein PHLGIDRAFT_22599 [Phlebiopsis gigantea 11061_1 CR5-6]